MAFHPDHPMPESFRAMSVRLEVLAASGVMCVVVEGPQGSGKTSLLRWLAAHHGRIPQKDLLYLHLGEQIDGKSLLGTFSSTSSPGQFEWRQGVLTKAVQTGMWVVLEDVDLAPADVVSLLLPLVKGRKLLLPGHVTPVRAASGFMLFLTHRTDAASYSQTSTLYQVLRQHCAVLRLPPMTPRQQGEIINSKYTNLALLIERLVETCSSMKIHMRKLLRLCDRVAPQVYDGKITSITDFMLEIIDCLCGHLQLPDKIDLASQLAHLCGGLSREKVEYLCTSHKPAVQLSPSVVSIGRTYLSRSPAGCSSKLFAHTRSSLALLEMVCVCVARNEPVLLVGETGVGKTATVSYLAQLAGAKLVVMNMSQQTDSADLLGGFKPVHLSQLLAPVRDEFERLFLLSFSGKKNKRFLGEIQVSLANHHWKKFLDLMQRSVRSALSKASLRKKDASQLLSDWQTLRVRIRKIRRDLRKPSSSLAFSFVEGALVEAVRHGHWILLDEINLASPETLQCLSSLLESPRGSFILPEKPDSPAVERSLQFRLFCCMNPATDVGKKLLPHNIRNRFTELYVDEVQSESDLQVIIRSYLKNTTPSNQLVQRIIQLYGSIRELAETRLQDSTGRRPHYSLRSLCRALTYADGNPCSSSTRSLYEGFCLTLLSELNSNQHALVKAHIQKCLKISDQLVHRPLPDPSRAGSDGLAHKKVGSFWLKCDVGAAADVSGDYVVTVSVQKNLENLARAISARSYPVLLQGPTSAGKTSSIQYIARVLGQQCLRINNHEHTDLQEYVGSYTTGRNGELIFQEGVLVSAMKKGHWIILDELNLAPTEVLEALNRVLDDNRELFVAETQELVQAHPNFMLFGTQNPPGAYGGRKILSRAFRNRFIELHFDDIPIGELVNILHLRCQMPRSYTEKMVAVMKDLQERRSVSGIFAGKHGLITLRDLFRWAERYRKSNPGATFHDWDQQLAEDGYMLLAGRLREGQDQNTVQEVIQKHFRRKLDPRVLFGLDGGKGGVATKDSLSSLRLSLPRQFSCLVWTDELLKMALLVHRCLQFDEPVLLVGSTGCGKTTLCQLISVLKGLAFFSINCHLHTEAADFLGGLRPARPRLSQDHDQLKVESNAIFEWVDGVVVMAMREGGCLMVDEISLADDAVLERLNSILEPERKLVVSERSRTENSDVFQISASEGFQFLATMNPGGDYGKKELSPALRNRFVEIWCSSSTSRESYGLILRHNLDSKFTETNTVWEELMLDVLMWLNKFPSIVVSVRDVLTWVEFMNTTESRLTPVQGFYHGAHLVFLDALGCGATLGGLDAREALVRYIRTLMEKCGEEGLGCLADMGNFCSTDAHCGIQPFVIPRGGSLAGAFEVPYSLEAPGPKKNAFRLLRAMQLHRPLLLEGAPGVGKTSLVLALAHLSGHSIVRINLSEQTDVSDLFGADLPVEGETGACFEWRDGPFLKALKNGDWIVLDEMNLASQSVLEGLNACLDHRGEVFIPELGMTFQVPLNTRIFACQNPLHQGGGRKGLPKSFLNRFTQVYVEALSAGDLLAIVSSIHPAIEESLLEKMIEFTHKVSCLFKALLCEFNLRDIFRWCELMIKHQDESCWDPGSFVQMIFSSRLRDARSREMVCNLFRETFKDTEHSSVAKLGTYFNITPFQLKVGQVVLERSYHSSIEEEEERSRMLLHSQIPAMEVLMACVQMNWMAILVGPACSGKSCLVHGLAALTGQRLLEFPMNSDTDTIDLLGGYEQVDLNRTYQNLMSCVRDVHVYLANYMGRRGIPKDFETLVHEMSRSMSESGAIDIGKLEEWTRLMEKLCSVLSNSSTSLEIPYDVGKMLLEMKDLHQRMKGVKSEHQFEWVDNVLVKALEQGHWLMISHANFCSPSVLDRLNALLEPGGVLRMDERGIVGDSIKVIKPHPNFRMFLTMDPSHGEISRAMRNRGVEIFMLPEDIPTRSEFIEDSLSLLTSGGIEHVQALEVVQHCKGMPTPFQLKLFARLCRTLKKCDGGDVVISLSEAAHLCGLEIDKKLSVDPLPAVHTSEGCATPISELCSRPSLTMAKRDLLPALHHLKTLSAPISHRFLGDSMLSCHLLVYLCCSARATKSLRSSLLHDITSEHDDQEILQADIDVWMMTLKSLWQSEVDWMPTTGFPALPESSVLSHFSVLGLEFLLDRHLLLAMNSRQNDSIIALSHRTYTGVSPLEKLFHPSLLYLHQCLCKVLAAMKTLPVELRISQAQVVEVCVDWLRAFIALCLEPNSDFSSITSAWTLLVRCGLQEFIRICDLDRQREVVRVLDCMKPLADIMNRNGIYIELRQNLGAPQPHNNDELQMKIALFCEDEAILRNSGPSWIMSGEAFENRCVLVKKWTDCLSGVLKPIGFANSSSNGGGDGGGGAVNTHDSGSTSSSSCQPTIPVSHCHALLQPAVACFRTILLSQMESACQPLSGDLDHLVRYLTTLPFFRLREMEPIMMKRLITDDADVSAPLPASVDCLFSGLDSHCSRRAEETPLPVTAQSCLSKVCFEFLSPSSLKASGEGSTDVPSSIVTLGNYKAKHRQIRELLQFLWLHGSAGVYNTLVYLTAERKVLQAILENLVVSIQCAILKLDPTDLSLGSSDISRQAVSKMCFIARSTLGDYAPWCSVESNLVSALYHLDEFDRLFAEGSLDNELELLCKLSLTKCCVGAVQSWLLCPSQVDPIVTVRTQYRCIQHQLQHTHHLIEAWQQHFLMMVGKKFTDVFKENRRPQLLSNLLQKSTSLLDKLESFPELPDARIDGRKYLELSGLAKNVVTSLCSEEKIKNMLFEVTDIRKEISWQKVVSWSKAVVASLRKLKVDYSSFQDVVAPFSAGLTMILDGLNTLALVNQFRVEDKERIVEAIRSLSTFPTRSTIDDPFGHRQRLLLYDDSFVASAASIGSISFKRSQILLAVSSLTEHAQFVFRLRHSQLPLVGRVLEMCWLLWSKAEEHLRAKEIEEQSLYKFRSKTHVVQESEDDLYERQLRDMFPSYEGIMEEEMCGAVESMEEDEGGMGDGVEASVDCTLLKFSAEDVRNVADLHLLIYGEAVCRSSRPPDSEKISYELSSCLTNSLGNIPGTRLDCSLLSSHAHMCGKVLRSLDASPSTRDSNIYKDPAPSENAKAHDVIIDLLARVKDLLSEWPDHPTLTQIVKACGKLMAMDLQVPLMKVLVGLEYILKKAQDWESYACSAVSLSHQLEAITNLILEWRKMELDSWKRVLHVSKQDVSTLAYRWWFHLYGLCREQMNSTKDPNEFISSLQQFMESSILGEFSTRLHLVSAFCTEMTRKGVFQLAHSLGNTFMFYKQFSAAVEQAMQTLVVPVEKDFNDCLLILRWNDGNYWAVKASTEKSHRTIVKLLNKYNAILHQPVQPVLTDSNTAAAPGGSAGTVGEEHKSALKQLLEDLSGKSYTHSGTTNSREDILSCIKLGENISTKTAHLRMVGYVETYSKCNVCCQWSHSVDDLTGAIIQAVHDLLSVDYLKGLESGKRRAAVKLRAMQKRKALSELFKALKQEGLSYRKAVNRSEDFILSSFKLPSQQLPSIFVQDNDVMKLWDRLQLYFYRCIARMATFQSSFHNPTKELNFSQVNRCQGYANQLMSLVQNQRRLLFHGSQACNKLQTTRQVLKQLVLSGGCVVQQSEYAEWLVALGSCTELSLKMISDFSSLVAGMPDTLNYSLTPYLQDKLPRITGCGDRSLADDAVSELQKHCADLTSVYHHCVQKEERNRDMSFPFATKSEVEDLTNGFQVVEGFLRALSDVIPVTDNQSTNEGMFAFLSSFHQSCMEQCARFSCWRQSCDSVIDLQQHSTPLSSDVCNLKLSIDESARRIFLSVQQVMADYEAVTDLMAGDADEYQNIKLLHTFTAQTLEAMQSGKVLECINKALSLVPTQDPKVILSNLAGWHMLFDQYTLFHKKIFIDLMLSHYALCKLLSVLLKTFTSLVLKGFCTPLESDSKDQAEGTEFVDIEAGGFDDGQGETNVSKSVEPDNLDGGGGQGDDEKKDEQGGEEGEEKDDAVEMTEDFEGDVEDVGDDTHSSDEENEEKEEDHQLGDLGSNQPEELDRNMWAPEENDEDNQSKTQGEQEPGGGTAMDNETRIVAKEDAAGESERDRNETRQSEQQEVAEEDGSALEDVNSEAPPEASQKEQEDLELGELSLDDVASDTEQEGVSGDEATCSEAENNLDGEAEEEGGKAGDKMEKMEDDDNLAQEENDDVWSKDQASHSGVEAASLDDEARGNSDAPANTPQESTEGKPSDVGGLYSAQEGEAHTRQSQQETERDMDRKMKRQMLSGRSDCVPATEEDEETSTKRPKLMEADESASMHDPETTSSTEPSGIYQHLRSDGDCNYDAIAWDVAQLDIPSGSTREPPEPDGRDQNTDAEEEMMDATSASLQKMECGTNENALPIEENRKEEMEVEKVEEIKTEKRDLEPMVSFFSAGNLSAEKEGVKSRREEDEKEEISSPALLLPDSGAMVGALERWLEYEGATLTLSQLLYEELRLILLPTKAASLKGDFRTGKRLNMRRVIPYIASNFQNNRIWLRRSKPSQREYQVLLAVDDSSSMKENQCIQMAYKSLALVSNALNKLEAGQLGICRFGESVHVIHPLNKPFTCSSGASVVQNLSFSQTRTNFVQMLSSVQSIFHKSKPHRNMRSRTLTDQLLLILSDGRGVFGEGSAPLEICIRKLNEMNIFCVFVILDSLYKDSIVDIQVPTFTAGKPLVLKTYLETFPFNFYIVLRDVSMLPHVLSQALRQWFELVAVHSAN